MESFAKDLKYAIRTFAGTPGFTATAVVALALGIGANTAIFSVVNAVLIEQLPFKNPERLVAIWEMSTRRPGVANVVGPSNYIRWRERATAFAGLAAFADVRTSLTGTGDPEELTMQAVTADFFPVLGVAPMLGRTFSNAENNDSNAPVVLLSHALWQRRFGGDPAVVGRVIQLNGAARTIIGVMPPDVRLLMKTNSLVGKPTDLWTPYVLDASARDARGRFLSVVARLKPGVTRQDAATEMSAIASALSAERPEFDTGWSVTVRSLRDELTGEIRPALLVLSGAVAFVLLIACANLANLLLARGMVRQREMAIRGALGATRARIVRQLMTETLLLGVAGGGLGLIVGQWGLNGLVALSPTDLTDLGHVELSRPVLAFTAAVSILTIVISGFMPALESARADIQQALKDASRQGGGSVRNRCLQRTFVVSEVALAVVLVAGAGLMLRSFASLQGFSTGLETRDVLTMRISLPGRNYDNDAKRLRFFREASQRVKTIAGVRAVGAISYLPFTSLGAATGFTVVGLPEPPPGQKPTTAVSVCDNGYFTVMAIPLRSGRFFSDLEMQKKSDVAIVNESLARKYFPVGNPLGKQIVVEMTQPPVPTTIIGVLADSTFTDIRAEVQPTVYWPHPQLAYAAMTLTVKTADAPLTFAGAVLHQLQAIDKDQPVSDVRSMDQWVARTLARDRFSSVVLDLFAALALLLASIGIYGVMSYAVSQRRSEIGVRLALGARRQDIFGLVIGGGVSLAAFGLGIGLILALGLSRGLSGLLFRTPSNDPATMAGAAILLATVAMLATCLPAARASRIAPTEALRAQ